VKRPGLHGKRWGPGLSFGLRVGGYQADTKLAAYRCDRSRDGGLTFEPTSTGLAGTAVHGLTQDREGALFAWPRGGGLFASRDRASTWHAVNTGEALQRSGVEAGRGTLLADPRHPGRLYLGNAGVIRIEAERDGD
jgi:hypothetical protein